MFEQMILTRLVFQLGFFLSYWIFSPKGLFRDCKPLRMCSYGQDLVQDHLYWSMSLWNCNVAVSFIYSYAQPAALYMSGQARAPQVSDSALHAGVVKISGDDYSFSVSSLLKEQNQLFLISGVAWARLCVKTLYIILDVWNEQMNEVAIGDQVCSLSLDSNKEVRDEVSIDFSIGPRPLCKSGGGRRKLPPCPLLQCLWPYQKKLLLGNHRQQVTRILRSWQIFKKTAFLLSHSMQKRTAPDWLSDSPPRGGP